jgi:hypothetical protein
MAKKIDEIRTLLDRLEADLLEHTVGDDGPDFLEIELASIVEDIVDLLTPLLKPYQVPFYWFLFRHSILKNGSDLLRVSVRGMQRGVVLSKTSDKVSELSVQEVLRGLEQVGAIRREAEPNRQGTLYRVLMPEQIVACQQRRAEFEAEVPNENPSEAEVDYYNVRENRRKIFERDSFICHYCHKQLTLLTATLDHVVAVSKGGDNGESNLITSCLSCNSRKNRKPVGDFLAETDGNSVTP